MTMLSDLDAILADGPHFIPPVLAARFIRKYGQQLSEAIRDSERLDWLADVDNTTGQVMLPTESVEANVESLRGAIDHAMQR